MKQSPARRGPLVLACLLLAAATAAGVWFLRPSRNLVDETLDLQRRVLAGGLAEADVGEGIDGVIRNVDKLRRDDVKRVRDALREEWVRVRQAAMDEYFAADPAGREAVLDRDIKRLRIARELEMAVDPRATGRPPQPGRPGRGRKPQGQGRGNASGSGEADAEKLSRLYREALTARAAARRISLPVHLLDNGASRQPRAR
ncbi:MAG: hypothetical protein EBZ59_05720 [Planctomycetia bacterium]|nr:hypothetical protein [Planctomycetia bacterium]